MSSVKSVKPVNSSNAAGAKVHIQLEVFHLRVNTAGHWNPGGLKSASRIRRFDASVWPRSFSLPPPNRAGIACLTAPHRPVPKAHAGRRRQATLKEEPR